VILNVEMVNTVAMLPIVACLNQKILLNKRITTATIEIQKCRSILKDRGNIRNSAAKRKRICQKSNPSYAKVVANSSMLANRLFVKEGVIYTSAGVSSGIDLALYVLPVTISPPKTFHRRQGKFHSYSTVQLKKLFY